VLLLPFHFVITFSGLVIFVFIYMKPGITLLYGEDAPKVQQEAFGQVVRKPAKQPGELASVDAMVTEAQAIWGSGYVRNVSIRNPLDKHAVVEVLRRPHDTISYETALVSFDAATGKLIGTQNLSTAVKVQRFFSGLHMIPFNHWGLRWMYFVMGLVSCLMIATGLLLWVEKRRVRQEREGRTSYRVVSAVTVASTFGVLVSTLSMLVANKLLPAGLSNRAAIEQYVFFAVWLASLAHPMARAWGQKRSGDLRVAWREQAWASAALALAAVVANAVYTGDHLLATLGTGNLAVAATDLVLLVTAALAAWMARRIAPVAVASIPSRAPVSEVVA